MTTTLEPVLTGTQRVVETLIERTTLRRWRRLHPELDFIILANRPNSVMRVRVILKPDDLKPAGPEDQIGKPERYAAGNQRGKFLWGIEVAAADAFEWLDNFATKDMVMDAARQWFMIRDTDPATVRQER